MVCTEAESFDGDDTLDLRSELTLRARGAALGEGERCEGFGRVERAERGGEYSLIRLRCGGELERRDTARGGGGGEGEGDWRLIATEWFARAERIGGGEFEGERREDRGGDGLRRKSLSFRRLDSLKLLI
jgi:hypothetical protein